MNSPMVSATISFFINNLRQDDAANDRLSRPMDDSLDDNGSKYMLLSQDVVLATIARHE
jgi:hypothetical protein